MFCTNCGAKLLENAFFCTNCGMPIQASNQQQNSAASPVPQPPVSASAYQEPPDYAYAETSVLTESPESLDTTVQPEETIVFSLDEMESQVNSEPQAQSIGYQSTQTGKGPVADDSETSVLGQGDFVYVPEELQQSAPVEKRVQLTRENGDTCILSVYPSTVGKGSAADLIIGDNSAISRLHARILRDGDMFAVEDLDSTNKTFINGFELAPHTPTILSDGDELTLANERIEVKVV